MMDALGMNEVMSIPTGFLVCDTMLKAAEVTLVSSGCVCAGKHYTVVSGEVAAVRAAVEAGEVLSATGDPQLSDFVLDRAYYAEMLSAARATGSDFLVRYVRFTIDAANLRSAVRTLRMKKGADMLRRVLVEGGSIRVDSVQGAALGGNLEELYRSTELRQAAELGAAAAQGGSLTAFEKACDDAVTAYLAQARRIPFGEQAVIGYLYAKELEFTAIRAIFAGRAAGLDGDTIRSRLRETYV